jgi:DNA-binding response OmpR family regulator
VARILVVDDERSIVEAISYNLRKEGHEVSPAYDAQECMVMARRERPDMALLDIMLPSGSGLELCRRLRAEIEGLPVLFLTARASEEDRLRGFDLGADDYMIKPFSMRELMARIRAVLRRATQPAQIGTDASAAGDVTSKSRPDNGIVEADDLVIDRGRREVAISGKKVDLSRKEFDLLTTLATNRGQVFDRQTLLNRVWGEDCYVEDRTVDVHIRWIREKIEIVPGKPEKILTVRGVGYKYSR